MLDLQAFLLTGRLGPIGPGATRAQVLSALGPPDARDAAAAIFLYGGLELHFLGDDLRSIFSDHLPLERVRRGRVQQDPWCLGGRHAVPLTSVRAALASAGVSCALRPRDPRWADPVPPGPRLGAAAWHHREPEMAVTCSARCLAELVLPSGVELTIGYHEGTLPDGTVLYSEDLIVALARDCTGASPPPS